MAEVAPARTLNLPPVIPQYTNEKTIRDQARQNWERIEQYELIWGYYPWERGRQPHISKYTYEPDPKQVARDRMEFIKAKKQLREEQIQKLTREAQQLVTTMLRSDVSQLATLQHVSAITEAIAGLASRVEEATIRFRAFLIFDQYASQIKNLLDQLLDLHGPSERKQVFASFVETLANMTGVIQIVHPDQYDQMSRNTALFYQRLKEGLRVVRSLLEMGAPAQLITHHLLAHDKSYLVSIGGTLNVMLAMTGVGHSVDPVEQFLASETNINVFTAKMGISSTIRSQLAQYHNHSANSPEALNMLQRIVVPLSETLGMHNANAIILNHTEAIIDAYRGVLPAEYIRGIRAQLVEREAAIASRPEIRSDLQVPMYQLKSAFENATTGDLLAVMGKKIPDKIFQKDGKRYRMTAIEGQVCHFDEIRD